MTHMNLEYLKRNLDEACKEYGEEKVIELVDAALNRGAADESFLAGVVEAPDTPISSATEAYQILEALFT